jgi:5-dehydro-4-deoxyglucarate dehydratase
MNLDGVLFFPVTPYTATGEVDAGLMKEHVASRLDHRPGAVFAACGTGEFHALAVNEVGTVVSAAVVAAGGRTPVLGGTGGPLGHAIGCAKAAADAGAEGLLVLPPYLVNAPADGLVRYVEAVAEATELPLIVYHRANAQLSPATMTRLVANPKVVGFKDGVGDIGTTQLVVLAVRDAGRSAFRCTHRPSSRWHRRSRTPSTARTPMAMTTVARSCCAGSTDRWSPFAIGCRGTRSR